MEDAVDTIGAYSGLNPKWIEAKTAQNVPDLPNPPWAKYWK